LQTPFRHTYTKIYILYKNLSKPDVNLLKWICRWLPAIAETGFTWISRIQASAFLFTGFTSGGTHRRRCLSRNM